MSSLDKGDKGRPVKSSLGPENGHRKGNVPMATSTPTQSKNSKSVSQGKSSKGKNDTPSCSPIPGNSKSLPKDSKMVDEKVKSSKNEKPIVANHKREASLPVARGNKKGPGQLERLVKSTAVKSCGGPPARKPVSNRPKISSTESTKRSQNVPKLAKSEHDRSNESKGATSKKSRVAPSIVEREVNVEGKSTAVEVKSTTVEVKSTTEEVCSLSTDGKGENALLKSVENSQETTTKPQRNKSASPPLISTAQDVSTNVNVSSGSSESSKTLSPSDIKENSTAADKGILPECKYTFHHESGRPLSPSIPARRRLSYTPPKEYNNLSFTGRRKSELTPIRGNMTFDVLKRGNNSVDSLKMLNSDLRDQVTRLRGQLDNQRGSIRQTQWQKVVEIRHIKEQEQQRLNVALSDQFQKLEREKQRDMEQIRVQLNQKFESEHQKMTRFKDTEISKLKLEMSSKDAMLQRLLGESRHARMKMDIDDRKMRLIDELKELRQAKKDLTCSLENANFAERAFSNNLRRHSETFESEVARVKKEAQAENRQLIEQLKNKDKLISQLEKDLGRQSWGGAAHFAALERRSEGAPVTPGGIDLSQPFRTLPEGSDTPDTFRWTPTSIQTPGDVEDAWTNTMEGNVSLGKIDLSSQLNGTKDRSSKGLQENCRSYLQQNKELSAQNRAFKESNDRATQDNKNAQELLEHSKLQLLQMSRQVNQLKAERGEWELEMRSLEGLRQELVEDKKMINALRKACSDKDRRIELIQHRKKRRRMIESAEKAKIQSAGLKETPFGYEEDDRQNVDGNQSVCSLSSTISDDSVWDDVLSKEEMERNYQRLMMEQLELQKSHALLQRQTDSLQDPQRENLSKTDLQNDLFLSQCRVEQLEHFVREGLQGNSEDLWEERERMQAQYKSLNTMVKSLEKENKRLQNELTNAHERNEDMEFRLMELEECREKDIPCQDTDPQPATSTSDKSTEYSPSSPADSVIEEPAYVKEASRMMEQLVKELNALLKDRGRDAESALKKLDGLIDKEKALESMAHELQMKVISLQQEKNSLQDKLLLVEQSQPGKGRHSASLAQAKERQENLALKAEIDSQTRLASERINLQGQVDDLKVENDALKQRVEALTHQQHLQEIVKEEAIKQCSQPSLQTPVSEAPKGNPSPQLSPLSRKSSDRKSKSRDNTDPVTFKRRKNSHKNESDDAIENQLSYQNVAHNSNCKMSQYDISNEKEGAVADMQTESEDIQLKMNRLYHELTSIKTCNDDLILQLNESVTKKMQIESSHQLLQEKLSSMEEGFDLLHKENVALGNQLRQRVEEFQLTQDERNPMVSELEEFCEDLQDRLKEAENSERQLREKLKLFEKTITEVEINEMAVRERCEQLLAGDYEAKKQIQDLQRTGLELRDIVLEKEIVEQALRDKVDFLQKAEAASVERVEELEGIVEDLRQQLDDKYPKEMHKMTEMKHQMTFLETDNKALTARVSELEENEEILRENWRRVAEEDFNRTQCLEEKVKMLEGLNRDLKVKLKDAQEYLVIDMSKVSLAAELEESESKLFDDSNDEDETDDAEDMDEVDYRLKESPSDLESKAMREKVRKLERRLSEVAELKNTKIEGLQERLVDLQETEIKLSETISEMEMTERELRAKLALYESSEVTVEKMLKYQSKIEELRTSQESLLDQLEIKEHEGMSLHEKMQEMERTLRGKIVTLEVEMKGYKQKELRNAGHIRDLEKQDKELSDKVAQQAEKENSLYIRISSLMDELKTYKTELENVKKQMEDKDDKVRQAKLLEVKLLEIEMECGKKVSTLNAKLRHREEEFRQKESAYEEQLSTLQDMHQHKSQLEKDFAQKEHDIQQMTNEKDEEISNLTSQVSHMQKNYDEVSSQMHSLETELENEQTKVCEKESLIEEMQSKVKSLESVVTEKETKTEMIKSSLESEIRLKENRNLELEGDLKEAEQRLKDLERAEKSEQEAAQVIISDLQYFSERCISDVQQKVASKLSVLETKLESMQRHVSELQGCISEQYMNICVVEAERDEQRKLFEDDLLKFEKERDLVEDKLRNEISSLSLKLEQERNNKESEQSDQLDQLKESLEREASLRFDVSNLQHQVEQHKHELISKLSELEVKNKAHCELSLELSNLRHEHKILQKELDKSKQSCSDMALSLKSVISEKDEHLTQASDNIVQLNKVVDDLKLNIDQKEKIIDQITTAKDSLIEKRSEENRAILEEKSQVENMFTEKCQEFDKINQLHLESERELVQIRKLITDKDHAIKNHEQEKGEKEMKLKETESHAQNVKVEKEKLTQELQSVKTVLEGAQTQISRQQQELQLLHTHLQSHQEDIKELQTIIKEKEEKLQEKDQLYNEKSSELKKLKEQLQDRDQKLEQADCKVADVELKLQKAENRVRELESMQVSLEMRLEERYAVSQNAEKVLRSKELQCSEMESKLEVAEKNLANLKDQISVGDESSQELAQRLGAKEDELQQKCSEVFALKESLAEKESLFVTLESKFNELELGVESTEADHCRKAEESRKLISEKENVISSMETRFQNNELEIKELLSELDLTKNRFGEKEKYCKECETQIAYLKESQSDLKIKYDNLESNLHEITQQLDQKTLNFNELQEQMNEKTLELLQCKELLSRSSQEVTELLVKLEETEKYLSDKKAVIENMTAENQNLKQSVEKLSSENTSVSVREEHLHKELQNKDEKNNILISTLESEKLDLTSVNESLRKQNAELQEKMEMMQDELKGVKKESLLIDEAKDSLLKQLSEIQRNNESLQAKIETLKSDISHSNTEREKVAQGASALEAERDQLESDNIQLQKEIDEAAKEFQNLTICFEESKNNIEKEVQEISKGKQNVEEKYQILQKEHKSQRSEMTRMLEEKDKEMEVLKQKCNDLTRDKAELTANIESLEQNLKEAHLSNPGEGRIEDDIVSESMIAVSVAPSLHSIPTSQKSFDSTLEAGKIGDIKKDQFALETTLNETKKNEKHLQKRVSELETVEKELREQIVDIEMTVIVPLENENQDLKDEIGMVKQERDEAISKISKWDDDDDYNEGKVQESETVHQRLEDALIYGEELEKKNEILLVDIQKLENDNDSMRVRITDLESSEMEKKDEIMQLQEEMNRLQEDHEDASVLEETETTLMDKVLDLEERERNLIQELGNLKKTATDPGKNWTDGMQEKMKYFEQKIQILEDAEGRYMDKIMELEEDKHRLLTEMSTLSDNHNSLQPQSQIIVHSSVNTPTSCSSTQTSFETNTVLGATYSSDGVDSSYHSDTLSSSGQSTSFPANESLQKLSVLEDQLQESKVKLEELDAQLREKETLVLYLQDKLELLQESEGKLMDKLLEAEEKASSVVHSKYSSQISELNTQIEQIQEENEFLAENVEQYKKSFKEEKEKCNNLQDRLMEDSVNLAELQRAQEELVKTQQMVEDIQSEYEDQLSERAEHMNQLQAELSAAVNKQDHLEQMVDAKAKREEELQEQVDSLQSTESELRSRLTLRKTAEDDSAMSDSGISADDPRIRNEHTAVFEEPVIHRSVKTVQLATSPIKSSDPPPVSQGPDPVPLPRYKRKLRQSSIEKIPHEELVFLVEDLQEREAALKKRVSDLQAIDESDLSLKLVDLESEKLQLERKLRYVEQQNASHNPSRDSEKPSELEVESYQKFSSGVPLSSAAMLEKPEDVLNQRIKELEGLDRHNKNTVSELERDREVLHEIARKDKATIHDLNVKIRELQLTERSLKEQVTNLEVSESSFFNKCEELEALRVQLEDRVHELEIHERRLRELVRKLKLDEERWLSKSGGMENAVAELSANEAQLKRIVQDMEMEKGGLAERLEYMEARIRELESVEVALLARIKDYENNEVILQNRNVQLENAGAATHSRASELDVINVNLTQQHKKMVDENAVMAQHVAQLHGQVQDLDRRLLSSRDSEIAYKQHVESLQKNESLLQKKVREYELREIDSQSSIRELEQTAEINSDKLAALQRSENRLRYRVQELEGVGGQIPGELTPSQQQKLPQNIEDCQKRIVVLQSQVENLKLQLRQTLNTTQLQSANKSDDEEKEKSNTVSVGSEEYSQLHVKAALLDEYAYQNEELESSQEQLRDTILQLRQGKGACGHEVEIEVYKRRIESLQTFIRKLKFSLSEGQTTSLLESELDSGPQGETLPARHLQVLESERVLQSVRGMHNDGKADDTDTIENNGGVHAAGLAPVEDSMIQTEAVQNLASPPSSYTPEFNNGGQKPEQSTRLEESHWKAIEARKPVTGNDSRGGVNAQPGRGGGIKVITSSPRHHGNQRSSTSELEEVTGVLNLHSESELSSYQRTNTLNESEDSCSSPIPPPRKNRVNRLSKNMSDDNSSVTNGSGSDRDQPHQQQYSAHLKASANQKHFGDGKSLPLTASNIERQLSSQHQQHHKTPAPLSRFAEDSFYLPSSTQEGVDSLDDDESAPPLPSQGPPGQDMAMLSGRSSRASMDMEEGRRESLDNSTSGLSIRERIAVIEKHLQSDTHTGSHGNREEEDQLFYWKRKSTENLRQAELLDKNNKFLKEDINRLEKELEEKRRYINTLEIWLTGTEDLLKNKSKQTDREMVEQLQLDLSKLRKELTQSGYRGEDAMLDAAALKTELEHRDKEIANRRIEIESLAQELRRCHKECRSIEGMRRTALDSLRSLEKEVVQLQDAEEKLKKAQTEINSLKVQYENKRMDLNTIISEKDELEYGMSKLIMERDSFKIDLQKTEKDRSSLQQQVEELRINLEDLSRVEEKNIKMEEEIKSLNSLLVQRNEKIREVYEENLSLRDSVNKSETELTRFRTLCDDFNNLSARYDEMDQFKNQALAMVQPLQLKVDTLTKKCHEKDLLLRRLRAELRRGISHPSTALEELTRLERAMNGEEYNTDNSDSVSDDLSPRPTANRTLRGRSVSMDELSLYSDTDSLNMPNSTGPNGHTNIHSPLKRQRPTPYINTGRPRSAEAGSNMRSPRRGQDNNIHTTRPSLHHHMRGFDLNQEHFVAIADYDPGLYSQSGWPRLELALREGDQVRVTGPMDKLGYCQAECNGRSGLVPANYLQPVLLSGMNGHHNPHSPGRGSLQQQQQHHHHPHQQQQQQQQQQQLHHHAPSVIHLNHGIAPPPPQFQDNQHYSPNGHLVPDPPNSLHVRGIENNCLVLAWKPPHMDPRGCNKGFQVKGYMVYVDNQEYEQIPNPQFCQVAIEGLDPSTPHHLEVQSLCAGGHVSPRAQLVFEGTVRVGEQQHDSIDNDDGPLDTDLSSVLNSVHYTKGAKKKVMALYEYNPKDQSPHDYTSFELAFHPGDVISVYGTPRPDGFYHGEMEGKRGLVPACFVEDLASRHGKYGSQDSGHESSKA